MKHVDFLPAAVAAAAGVVVGTALPSGIAQDAAAPHAAVATAETACVRTPFLPVENEPPPRLIVDEPLPEGLNKGIIWIRYRTENCRILPAFGKGALNVSPRVGHLHIHVDDLPWLWADASDLNTIDIAGMPPGERKVLIELVDANHHIYSGQAKTVRFTVPMPTSASPSR